MPSAPDWSRVGVHQGGKEELRATVLKTYLLRVRGEKGERAVRNILSAAGIDRAVIENETGWVSSAAAKKALRAIKALLGEDSLRNRGEYVTHAEALGTLVRMLRRAEQPIDAYRYLASNAREVTRVGTWEIQEPMGLTKIQRLSHEVRMTYRLREAPEEVDKPEREGEEFLCEARQGELAGIPLIWGLEEAVVTQESCIAAGADACTYHVHWKGARQRNRMLVWGILVALLCGGAIFLVEGFLGGEFFGTSGISAALVAAIFGGVLGGIIGFLWDRSLEERSARVFERNRIAALERGLELRGEMGATPSELTGTILGGKYRIGRKIGSGGIGVVYAAEHMALGHEVAIKVLRGAAARDAGEIARLRREAYIQVHVEHPHVARVLDLDQMPDGSIYVVMERLIGRSLAEKLSREGLLAPGLAIPLFIDVARGLAAAHEKGFIHRDLKPGNIFLCEDGSAKLLDFGMSKLTTAEALTQAGYTLGTPEYMAPEQCIGAVVEARTDIYALGVLMYEALTGSLPITAKSRRELLDLHQRQVPIPMRAKRIDLPIPQELDDAVMTCLKKRMSDRPQSAGELANMLEAIPLEGLPTSYPPGIRRVDRKSDAATMRGLDSVPPPAPSPPVPAASSSPNAMSPNAPTIATPVVAPSEFPPSPDSPRVG